MLNVCIYTFSFLTGERFSPGVGQVNATDEIKREIIHQLSIKPMAHSELVKSLPEDVSTYISKKKTVETFPSQSRSYRFTSIYLSHNCKIYYHGMCIIPVTLIINN